MSAARLILLPLFVIDVTTSAHPAIARAEKLSILLTAATKLSDPSRIVDAAQIPGFSATDVEKDREPQIVLAEEKSLQGAIARSADPKAGNEKSAAIPAAPKAPSGEKNAASAPSSPSSINAPVSGSEEQRLSAEKSPSILQMLEGHEPELLGAAAIALAFFFIGWICGGNYYLRRDRRQRTKLRF